MRLFSFSRSARRVPGYGASIGLAVLTGCAGNLGSSAATPTAFSGPASAAVARQSVGSAAATGPSAAGGARTSWISPAAKSAPLLYVSEGVGFEEGPGGSSGYVEIYDQRGTHQTPIGQIAGLNFNEGLHVSKNGDLYVAEAESFDVQVYHRGGTLPFETLSDPNEYADNVAEGPEGTIFVSSGASSTGNFQPGPGDVAVYAPGSLSPTGTLTDPRWTSANAVAVDSRGDAYVCWSGRSGNGIEEFPKGSAPPIDVATEVTNCGEMIFDQHDHLVVADETGIQVLFGPNGPWPLITFDRGGLPHLHVGGLAFGSTAKNLYVPSNLSGFNTVWVYDFPRGRMINTITQGLVDPNAYTLGVAADPGITP